MRRIGRHLTFANVVACLALFIALGGASYAAFKLPPNSVGTKQLKKGAVTGAKIKPGSLLAKNFKKGQLPAGPPGPPGPAGGAASTPVPHARIRLAGQKQKIEKGSRVGVVFDSVVEDNAGMANLATHPATLVAPRTGLYLIAANLTWVAIQGQGRVGGLIQVATNPAGTEFLSNSSVSEFGYGNTTLNYMTQSLSETVRMNAGQYAALVAFQEANEPNQLQNTDDGTWLELTYLGP
ncbi:MAG: hypothetical protein U0R71_03255 [Solirubrobacterales bacterium]